LKLEPTEAEAMLIPPLPAELDAVADDVDRLARAGSLNDIVELVDELFLVAGLGMSSKQIDALRKNAAWLRERRRLRTKAPRG
jgi:hypothetical protein